MTTFTLPLSGADCTLTAYLLDPSPEMPLLDQLPALLILPGGGYHMCSDREAEPIALAYAAQGYHAFVLRYTVGALTNGVANVWPAPLWDAEEAMTLIRQRAQEWRVKPDRIAAIGFSAGGHLCSALGTMSAIRPDALLLGYPCTLESMNPILAFPVPSSVEAVTADTPPTFLFSTADDAVVPIENSLAFLSALAKNGVSFESHIFKSGRHGLSVSIPITGNGLPESIDEDFAQWHMLSIRWLRRLWN